MKVDILNGRGESVSKLPGDRRKLLVELKVIWHGRMQLPEIFVTLRFAGAFCIGLSNICWKLFTAIMQQIGTCGTFSHAPDKEPCVNATTLAQHLLPPRL